MNEYLILANVKLQAGQLKNFMKLTVLEIPKKKHSYFELLGSCAL